VLDRTKSNVASLRKALARQVPAAMLPASFTVLEALPRTPSGKVDRKALPKPDVGYVNTPSASGSTVPAALTKSWIDALKLPSAPPSSIPFVDLGGHSLLLARLHKSLRDSGSQVPFGRLHGAMTLEEMHAAIEAHASKKAGGAEEAGPPAAEDGDRVVGVPPGRAVLLAVLELFAALLIASFALRCGLAVLGPQARTRSLGQYGRVESLLRELPHVATEDGAVLVYGSSPATFGIAPELVDAGFAANGRDVKCFNLGTPMLTPRSLGVLATMTRDAFRRSGKRASLSVVELSPTLSDYESFAEMEALLLSLVPLETSLPLVPTASAPMTFYHRAVIGLPPVAYRQLVDMTILEDSQWWWFTPQRPAPEEMLTQTKVGLKRELGYDADTEWRFETRGGYPREDDSPAWAALRRSEAKRLEGRESRPAELVGREIFTGYLASARFYEGSYEHGAIRELLRAFAILREVSDEVVAYVMPLAPYADLPPALRENWYAGYREVATAAGVRLVVLEDSIVAPEDYLDLEHLTLAGRRKVSRILGERLAGARPDRADSSSD